MTEEHVRSLATSKSFERGVRYFLRGAIFNQVIYGMELRALCKGSAPEPYKLKVSLTEDGIDDLYCSCPYSGAGICKHLVALLLTYINKPE